MESSVLLAPLNSNSFVEPVLGYSGSVGMVNCGREDTVGDGEVDWDGDVGVCHVIVLLERVLDLLPVVRDCIGEAAPSGGDGGMTFSVAAVSILCFMAMVISEIDNDVCIGRWFREGVVLILYKLLDCMIG